MSRPRPPYLIKRKARNGGVSWYVWKRPGPQIRIRAEPYGSRAFMDEYRAALFGEAIPKAAKTAPGSLAALISDYQQSDKWASFSDATRASWEPILRKVSLAAGAMPVSEIDRAMIIETRERAGGPAAAKTVVQALRTMFKWAVDVGRMEENPAEDVRVYQPKTEGFHVWTDDEIERYERRWPIGSRERLWLSALLYTGLRRGDLCRLETRQIDGDIIALRTQKTGTPVYLPIVQAFKRVLDASKLGRDYLLEYAPGQPFTPASFSVLFGKACRAAGVPGSAHGLRKAAATRLAEAGCSVHELNSVFGWTGNKMASRYTEKADRARLARQAFEKASRK